MNSQEINNNVLGAMQILIDKSMTNLVGGETVICTIVDDTERQLGKYRVSPNEVVVYDAYSENTEYLEGEQVLVLIPDKSSDKRTIIRKYISKNTLEPLHYVSPAKQFIVQSELYNSNNETFDINLNDATQKELILNDGEIAIDAFDTCYIQTRFLCNVTENVTSGNYGLKFTLTEKNPIDTNKVHYAEVILDSNEMMGNPYRFIAPFMQEKIGYWKDLPEGVYTWSLILYQNNNFKNQDGEPITGASVTVSDIKIQIGYDVTAIPNKTVKLFYSGTNFYDNPSTNKTVSLVWYKKSNDNEYVGFGEDNTQYWPETIDEAKQCGTIIDVHSDEDTRTLTLILDTNQRVPLVADDGEQFEALKNEYSIGKLITYTIAKSEENLIYTSTIIGEGKNVYFIDWQQDNSRGNLVSGLGEQLSRTTYNCICQSALEKTRVNAVLWENGFAYPAEKMLEFENKGERTIDLNLTGVTMKIKHGANSKEAYTKYDGTSNQLIESTEAYINRTLEFNWDTDLPENTISPEFWSGAQITWYIPANGTMLKPVIETDELELKNDYYVFTNIITCNKMDDVPITMGGHTIDYRIKDYYSPQLTNNTIKCQVTITQEVEGQEIIQTLTGEITIGFGLFGTSGTDYTIVVTSSKIVKNGENYTLKFQVIDIEGNTSKLERQPQVRLNAGATYEKCEYSGTEYLCNLSLQIGSYNLIEISASVDFKEKEVNIVSYFPIIVYDNTNEEVEAWQLIFPTGIFYDYNGQNPEYLIDSWRIVDGSDDSSWKFMLEYYDYANSSFIVPDDIEYVETAIGLPKYIDNEFLVPPIYVNQTSYGVAIRAVKEIGEDGNAPYLRAPILITQNKYFSTLLNEWNGALAIDEQNNYILSAMVGAGKKNKNNTFSGIIMGKKATLDLESNNFEDSKIGLFGFNEGVQSYGFNIDGTAFIGASGQGQIKFDGNRGYIASPGVIISSTGEINMPIDGGSIFDLKSGNLWLQQSDNDYFKFVDDEFEIKMGKLNTGNEEVEQEILINPQDYSTLFLLNKEEFYIGTPNSYLSFLKKDDEAPVFDMRVSDFAVSSNNQISMRVNGKHGFIINNLTNDITNFSIAQENTNHIIRMQDDTANYVISGTQKIDTKYYRTLYVPTGAYGYGHIYLYENPGENLKIDGKIVYVDIKKKISTEAGAYVAVPCNSEGALGGVGEQDYIPVYYTTTPGDTMVTMIYSATKNLPGASVNCYEKKISDVKNSDDLKIGYVKKQSAFKLSEDNIESEEWTKGSATTTISGGKLELSEQGYLYLGSTQIATGLVLGTDPHALSDKQLLQNNQEKFVIETEFTDEDINIYLLYARYNSNISNYFTEITKEDAITKVQRKEGISTEQLSKELNNAINNTTQYALQIGTFKVKWDGTIEGI